MQLGLRPDLRKRCCLNTQTHGRSTTQTLPVAHSGDHKAKIVILRKMVGAEGFELSTYGTQNRRATRLRYAPTLSSAALPNQRRED